MPLMAEQKQTTGSGWSNFRIWSERASYPDQCVFRCLCESAPEHVRKAMLTRLDSGLINHI
ncbi:LOW QUALITY PROTEIN: hypothetical protein PHMEG_00031952 [Phytophthora megakarya]|uniref:Uncharacterized protein n=1 Tax=Phytophthora megakarya TaxID=4795 RepID=A0A225UWI6_9STRA|nr:LOW QUALITY PROTEIN: hypothetical protein PHMEG_00031952 [Phytophthora megakarya]